MSRGKIVFFVCIIVIWTSENSEFLIIANLLHSKNRGWGERESVSSSTAHFLAIVALVFKLYCYFYHILVVSS